jgi:hypothetical protein
LQQGPRATQLRLRGVLAYTQLRSNLLVREAVYCIEVEDDAIAGREIGDQLSQVFGLQLASQLVVVGFAFGSFDVCFQVHAFVLTQVGERFVYHDATDPSFEASIAFVLADPVEHFREGYDHHIFGVHPVFYVAAAQGKHASRVVLEKKPLRVAISFPASIDQLVVYSVVNLVPHLCLQKQDAKAPGGVACKYEEFTEKCGKAAGMRIVIANRHRPGALGAMTAGDNKVYLIILIILPHNRGLAFVRHGTRHSLFDGELFGNINLCGRRAVCLDVGFLHLESISA